MSDHMPETKELPVHAPNPQNGRRRGRVRWFIRGFAAAALLFATFLFFDGYFGVFHPTDAEASRTIIVGK